MSLFHNSFQPQVRVCRMNQKIGQGDKDFDKFCGNTPNHISKEMVIFDIEELSEKAKKCEGFADRVIAHTDRRDPKFPLTYEDINRCIAFLDKLYCKYNLIFNAVYAESLLATYQYDWQEIFKVHPANAYLELCRL